MRAIVRIALAIVTTVHVTAPIVHVIVTIVLAIVHMIALARAIIKI